METTSTSSEIKRKLSFVTERPIAITMFVIALAVFGAVSFSKLHVDLLPEISYPTLTVRTTWEGAAPEDIEERVSERIQEALSTLPGLVRSSSISRAGTSDVLLDFNWETEMTFAVQDVREKLDGVFLPRGVDRPLILRYDPNLDPILRIGLTSVTKTTNEADLIGVRWIAENRIKRELEALPGVAAVQVRGGLEEEIRVRVDPFALAARKIDPSVLATRLAQENINASGGSLLEGSTEYLVRTLNEFRDTDEIADLSIIKRGDASIRVRDVAVVERTHKKREVISRLGGSEMVEFAIYREAGANIVQLASTVKDNIFGRPEQQATAKEIQERETEGGAGPNLEERSNSDFLAFRHRKNLTFELLSDQSTFISSAIDDVKNAAVMGSLFAVLVIWVFLRRLSATFIIGLAIPISVIVTFAPMYMFGVSLNIMSLGGLAIGVGMLVDNAIVVLESISRCRDEGDNIKEAATRGAREVAGAVIASTLTTIAVFAPIVFVTGIAGQIFGDQALTVVTSLLVSLVVAILFIPMLASRGWLAGSSDDADPARRPTPFNKEFEWNFKSFPSNFVGTVAEIFDWKPVEIIPKALELAFRSFAFVLGLIVRISALVLGAIYKISAVCLRPFSRAFDGLWVGLEAFYVGCLKGAVRQPILIIAVAGLLFWAALGRVASLGIELLPEIHQGEFTAHVAMEIGSPLEFTDRAMRELDREIQALEGVETTALTTGIEPESLSRDIEGSHTARLAVRLKPEWGDSEREEELATNVRRIIARHPAVHSIEIRRPTPFALESPVAVEVKGYDLEVLEAVSEEVFTRLSKLDSLTDLKSSVRPGHPEALITFDRDKTLEYGLDLVAVSNLVRDQVLGSVGTRFNQGNERVDVRVIGDELILSSLESVLNLTVNPNSDTPVPLRSVAEVRTVQGPAEIRRIGNTRGILITAERTGFDLSGVNDQIRSSLASLETPDEVIVEQGGQKREMEEAQKSMQFALILAVFLVYVVMASQFESLVQPFIILLTVPLAGVGVVFTLDQLNVSLSVVVFIGLIMLAGIVVNNAIVLVDRINQKREQGIALREAVLEAGRARLRPILMTTATTALGLLPLTGWLAGVPLIGELGSGEGAELRAPMAITVIAGLVASTMLTLVVIPSVYALLAKNDRRSRLAPQD